MSPNMDETMAFRMDHVEYHHRISKDLVGHGLKTRTPSPSPSLKKTHQPQKGPKWRDPPRSLTACEFSASIRHC